MSQREKARQRKRVGESVCVCERERDRQGGMEGGRVGGREWFIRVCDAIHAYIKHDLSAYVT